MSTLASSSLRMNHHRSSSCSDFALRILNNEDSPASHKLQPNTPERKVGFLQKSLDSTELSDSPAFYKTRSTMTHYEPSRFLGYKSTRPSTINLSPKTVVDDYVSTPELSIDLELLNQDDEEISPREIAAPKESDFEVSINMVINEIIASNNASVSYPCYVSVKPKEEYVAERLSVDLTLILDIKNNEPSSLSNTLDKFLSHLNEKDRLSLFSTQNTQVRRFPLRMMQEAAKTELINEFNMLTHLSSAPKFKISVPQVLKAAISSAKNRRYKNHINAIFLLTDSNKEMDFSHIIDEETKENPEDSPLLFAFSIGQKQNSLGLQEICEFFEGKCHQAETTDALSDVLTSCLLDLSYIRVKNIRLSFDVESERPNDDTLKIAKVYEKKTLIEESAGSVEAHTNYFSMKEGIDIALEVEISKCRPVPNDQVLPYLLNFTFVGDAITQDSKINLRKQKALNISRMHPLMRMMPKEIDKKALESFYRVKVAKIVAYSVKIANDGYLKQSLQLLNNLKKELYTFTMLRSEAIQKMMKTIECTLSNLQSTTFRSKEKVHAFRGLNFMVGI